MSEIKNLKKKIGRYRTWVADADFAYNRDTNNLAQFKRKIDLSCTLGRLLYRLKVLRAAESLNKGGV